MTRRAATWIAIALVVGIGALLVWLLSPTADRSSAEAGEIAASEREEGPGIPRSEAGGASTKSIQPTPFKETDEGPLEGPSESRGAVDRDRDLHGMVVDPSAQPVQQASIEIVRNEARELGVLDLDYHTADRKVGETKTDSDGRFRFRLPQGRPCDVIATAPGYPRTTIRNRYAGEHVLITLAPGATLKGTVTRASDQAPVAGAKLRGWREKDHAPVCAGVTDAAGQYQFDDLQPGPIVVELEPVVESAPPWRHIELQPGQVVVSNFDLEAGSTVTGQIVDATTKEPIADAEIGEGFFFFRPVRSGPDGRFILRGVAGKGRNEIHARARGYGRRSQMLPSPLPAELEINFALTAGKSVRGRVIATDGTPVVHAYVAAPANSFTNQVEQQSDWPSARSGSDGRFEIRDLRSDLRHAIWIRKEGLGSTLYDLPPRETTEDPIEVGDIVLQIGGSISGIVVDTKDRPQADMNLALDGVNADRFKLWEQGVETRPTIDSYLDERAGRTDDLGRFRFTDLAAGEYRLRRSGGSTSHYASGMTIQVPAGGKIEGIRLVVPIELSIKGRMEDPDGQPVTIALVEAYPESAGAAAWVRAGASMTLAGGAFDILRLPEGTYTLVGRALEESGAPRTAAVKLTGIAAGATDVRLVLPQAAPITGTVLSSEGKPVKDVLVEVLEIPSGIQLGSVQTQEDGSFSIDVKEDDSVALKLWTPHPLKRPEGTKPASWGDPTLEVPSVRAGTKSLFLTFPKNN